MFRQYILLLLIVNISIASYAKNVIGWYNEQVLATKIKSFKIFQDSSNTSATMITETQKTKFDPSKETEIDLTYTKFNGKVIYSKKIVSLKLEKAPTQFPIHSSIAVNNKFIVVAWQETSLSSDGTKIMYVFKQKGDKKFSQPTVLYAQEKNKTYFLPLLKTNINGDIFLYFQDEKKDGRFTLAQAKFGGSQFSDKKILVNNMGSIGRGIFFPSITFGNSKTFLFYQNRAESNYRDEIFMMQSDDDNNSFSSPKKLTSNEYNDYSPYAIFTNQAEWVWQVNPSASWQVFYNSQSGKEISLTAKTTNAYLPQLVKLSPSNRLVVWYDFRNNPAQVYGKIFSINNSKKDFFTWKSHNISSAKINSRNPKTAVIGNSVYVFYLKGSTVVTRKLDQQAQKLQVFSLSHPRGKVINNNNVKIQWKIPLDPSGIAGYFYKVDGNSNTIPKVRNVIGSNKAILLENQNAGKYFIHLRYQDQAGNLSPVSHYPFFIDNVKPALPLLKSPSHREKVATKVNNVKFTFPSSDDTGVKYFRYAFSPNRAAKLNKISKKNNITFFNVPANNYYFQVRAEDAAGNLSEPAIYSISIIPDEKDRLKITSNIKGQELFENNLQIKIYKKKNKKPIKCFALIRPEATSAFENGEICKLVDKGKYYEMSLDVKAYTNKVFVATLGLRLEDGSKIPERAFTFKLNRDSITFKKSDVVKFSSTSKVWVQKASNLLPTIKVSFDRQIFLVNFSVHNVPTRFIAGYSYIISEKLSIPNGVINSQGGPEFIFNLKPGKYYLNVKPIFGKKSLKKKFATKDRKYSTFVIYVPDPFLSVYFSINKLTYTLIMIAVIFSFTYYNRRRIKYMFTRLKV